MPQQRGCCQTCCSGRVFVPKVCSPRLATHRGCTSRRVLWSNVLYLIAQKPWLGWGWGELDFAHYSTLFPGERFCVFARQRAQPATASGGGTGPAVAVLACAAVAAWIWRARPWRENGPGSATGLGHSRAGGAAQHAGVSAVVRAVPVGDGAGSAGAVAQSGAWFAAVRGMGFMAKWPQRLYLKALAAIVSSSRWWVSVGLLPCEPGVQAGQTAPAPRCARARWTRCLTPGCFQMRWILHG